MDYLFRLADGRRVALWSEKNQIIRQLSGGGGNRSHMTLRTDFLSDFSAASLDGKIYFTYQNTSRRVMLYLPDGEEDRLLFGESIESCRHGGLNLIAWNGRLYLFYTAWSPIKESYALKMRKPLEAITQGDGTVYADGEETILTQELGEAPEFQVISGQKELWVISGGNCWRLTAGENGAESWQEGIWTAAEMVDGWEVLRKKAEEAKQKMQQIMSERKQLEEENSKLREWKSGLQEENRVLREKISEYDAEQKRLMTEKEEFQTEQRRLKTEAADFQEEIQRLAEECEKLKLEKSCEQEEFQYLQTEKQELLQKISRYEAEEKQLSAAKEQIAGYRGQLQSAVTQYNDLAEVARQLQIEGKKWRDKYYQEAKKRRVRQPESD